MKKKTNKQTNKQLVSSSNDSKVKNKKGLRKLWKILRLNSTIYSEKLQLLSAIMYSIICVRVFL